MAAPVPMLSASGRRWPDGGEWVLQPKWDGFRLLVEVDRSGRVRAWSRHATNLTDRLGDLLDHFAANVAPETVFDGELVAIGERDGRPTQDFAAVTRGVFAGEAQGQRLQFVAFDILRHRGQDVQPLPWRERDALLRESLPAENRVRLISNQPATLEAHAAIIGLGFEGSVLKRPASIYRPGRHSSWVKHKARCRTKGTLLAVYQAHDGTWQATCEVDGRRRVRALAGPHISALVGSTIDIIYSRVDADGSLREARVALPPDRCS